LMLNQVMINFFFQKQIQFNSHKYIVEHCPECITPFIDPSESELFISLHALRYTFYKPIEGWVYKKIM
jgi:hypothetical protein